MARAVVVVVVVARARAKSEASIVAPYVGVI
jgi:hypothetical protein